MNISISGVWEETASNRLQDMHLLLALIKPAIPMTVRAGKVKSGADVLVAHFKPSSDTEVVMFVYGDGTYGYHSGWVGEIEPLYMEGDLQLDKLPTNGEVVKALRNE